MKTRGRIICMMILAVAVSQLMRGQEFKFTTGSSGIIKIQSLFGELYIEGISGSDMIISTEDYKKPPPRADGLKPLYSDKEDNTGIGLSVLEEPEQVIVTGALKQSQDATYHIKVPESIDLVIDLSSPWADDITIQNIKGELDIKSLNSNIELLEITGPAVIHSVNGRIEGNFLSISQENPSSVSTVNGIIDMALPAGGPANLEIGTNNGEAYSDLDLQFEKSEDGDMKRIGGNIIKGKLGNGGVSLKFISVNGDIYLREK
ncbi:MAG: hypothetical protein AMS27_12170 [Bacteroides sp. SM23_62_1]|nr:MAG: hypothetical protein AMS27_12170 [Bacteroides sp. SM23_62_1]